MMLKLKNIQITLNTLRRTLWIGGLFLFLTLRCSAAFSEEHENPLKPRPESDKTTSQACWHAQLMRIQEYMINNQESISTYIPEKNGKKFTYNKKASVEMNKGSRMEVFETEKACEIILSFRGTESETDIIQDLNAMPDKSRLDHHAGFVAIAESYKEKINQVLTKAREDCAPENIKVTLTGHSMGGAVAYVVANILKNINLGSLELVLFGAPKVVTKFGKEPKIKGVHYFIDQDSVVLLPPGAFRDLTDNMYQFKEVPITEAPTSQKLLRNHLPSNYLTKMDRWCEGGEKPEPVREITHTVINGLIDATKIAGNAVAKEIVPLVIAANDVAEKNLPVPVVVVANAVAKKIVPVVVVANTVVGKIVPVVDATIATGVAVANVAEKKIGKAANAMLDTGRSVITLATAPDDSKPFAGVKKNDGDGRGYARDLACKKGPLAILYSITEVARDHFCNERKTGFNGNTEKGCINACGDNIYKENSCFKGCADDMHKFCIGRWDCG